MPAGSKMDPLLAKAEPISDGGSASGIIEFGRGTNCCATATAAGERRCERNSPADTKVSEEGGEGGAPGAGISISLQPLEQLVKNCSPWEGLTLEKLVEDCLLWEGPQAGAGAECEESSPGGGRSGRDTV
ncbi:F-box only protein 31 [Grus japonensis]|uniref:F-box only protein 31 n=1 Tax=Grus japonensis TaxID=30415 RepID=A0ABC9Y768_GRUJA